MVRIKHQNGRILMFLPISFSLASFQPTRTNKLGRISLLRPLCLCTAKQTEANEIDVHFMIKDTTNEQIKTSIGSAGHNPQLEVVIYVGGTLPEDRR
jgi:hypothetical protein